MSDANRVGLAYVAESTFGVTPSGPPTLQTLRYTSESFEQQSATTVSQEIDSTRQVADLIRTDVSATGSLGVEISYGAYDDFYAAALQASAWSSAVTDTQTTFSAAASDNSLNDSGNGFVSAGFTANQWIKVSGFTGDTSNNGYFKIVSVAAGKIVVSHGTLVDDAAGESVTITQGSYIENGTTLTTYSIEKVFADVSSTFQVMRGMGVNTFALNVQAGQVMTGSFGFVGKTGTSGTSTVGDGSNTAATTKDVMNAIDDVTAIHEGGSSTSATQFSLNVANGLRARSQIATEGAASLASADLQVTGTFQGYFTSKALLDKFLNRTASSVANVIEDEAGDGYVIDCPQVKYSAGKAVAGSKGADVLSDMAWTAYKDPTELITIRIARFPAA